MPSEDVACEPTGLSALWVGSADYWHDQGGLKPLPKPRLTESSPLGLRPEGLSAGMCPVCRWLSQCSFSCSFFFCVMDFIF
uniref:Uncharacterized protein n=1 Tax=Varanus komodoensis TaxID=61221 RepID=A0A8D2LD09_VARKO